MAASAALKAARAAKSLITAVEPLVVAVEGRLAALIPDWPRARLALGFSGGVDSVVLLHVLRELRQHNGRSGLQLRAIHVDHRLHAASRSWRAHCEKLTRSWRIPLAVCEANIVRRRGESPEAAARVARYALLANELRRGEMLLTAQHADDQLETFLLQLLRGAGAAGLSAMPEAANFHGSKLLRPLLGVQRAQLLSYARANKLSWIEDPSNSDTKFDRNYLRARVLPSIRQRWPSAAATVSRSARHLAEAQQLIAALAEIDLSRVESQGALNVSKLVRLPGARQRSLLRHWLTGQGLIVPDTAHLARISGELPAARADANPVVRWPGGEVRRFRGLLFCAKSRCEPPRSGDWHWRRRAQFELGEGWGSLRVVSDAKGPWTRGELPTHFRVSFRAGGERLPEASYHRSLKELLRSAGVLPWMRANIPIVSSDCEVWCVPQLWSRERADVTGKGAPAARVAIAWHGAPQWRLTAEEAGILTC